MGGRERGTGINTGEEGESLSGGGWGARSQSETFVDERLVIVSCALSWTNLSTPYSLPPHPTHFMPRALFGERH